MLVRRSRSQAKRVKGAAQLTLEIVVARRQDLLDEVGIPAIVIA
jgi:hypothetical protein